MHGQAEKRRPRSRATTFLAVASLVSLTVLLVGIAWPALTPRPRVTWHVGGDPHAAVQMTQVTNGTPVSLEIDLPFEAYVYVATWSLAMGTIALFPSEQLVTPHANPLPAGVHLLPGAHDDKPTTWPTPNVIGPIYYLVVVSRQQRSELESALHRVRQMGHLGRPGSGFEDRGMYLFVPEAGLDESLPLDTPIAPELEAARAVLGSLPARDAGGAMRELDVEDSVFVRPFVVNGN